MIELSVTRILNASADKVWAVLSNFGDLSWVPGPDKVEVIGSGVGMIRRIYMGGTDPFDEVLQSLSADQKTVTYSIPKNAFVPFDNYTAAVTVLETTDSTSQVIWRCTLDSGHMPETDAKDLMRTTYDMMLNALADRVEN